MGNMAARSASAITPTSTTEKNRRLVISAQTAFILEKKRDPAVGHIMAIISESAAPPISKKNKTQRSGENWGLRTIARKSVWRDALQN